MAELAPEQAQISAVIQKYIDAIAKTRPEAMLEIFHPQAIMAGQFDGQLRITAGKVGEMICDFMKQIPPTAESSPNFRGRIVSVTQRGDIAAVEIAEDQLGGRDMRTFFLLNKVNGAWTITAKATTNTPGV